MESKKSKIWQMVTEFRLPTKMFYLCDPNESAKFHKNQFTTFSVIQQKEV